MELPISTTRGRIQEANNEFLDSLDIFRLINCPSPRNWEVKIVFDFHGDYTVHLLAKPPLSTEQLHQLLDGRMPSLFAFKGLSIKVDGVVYLADLSKEAWANERETFFNYIEAADETIEGQLKIVGYALSPRLSNKPQFKEWLYANTWLGSRRFAGLKYDFYIKDLGISEIITPVEAGPAHVTTPTFKCEAPLEIDKKIVGCMRIRCGPPGRRTIRHSSYGTFRQDAADHNFWKRLNLGDVSVELEIDEKHLSWHSNVGTLDFKYLRQLLDAVINQTQIINKSQDFRFFCEALLKYEREATASKLLERQNRLKESPIVIWKEQELLAAPSCENELVALYMKIEALGLLPFTCKVLEYTSRAGIDALATFRIEATAATSVFAPVEFELSLENYFDHDHPLEQTCLIICWDKDDELCNGRWRNNKKPWLAYVIGNDRDIPVLIVSSIPNLQVKH